MKRERERTQKIFNCRIREEIYQVRVLDFLLRTYTIKYKFKFYKYNLTKKNKEDEEKRLLIDI